MCTMFATQIDNSWVLGKTRDPVFWMRWDDEIKLVSTKEDKIKKLLIQNPEPREDGYYGGINENGVAYTATYIPTFENSVSYIRRPYVRLILDAKTAKEGVSIIERFSPRIGGNMFIADKNSCFLIEGALPKYSIEQIEKASVRTNHFSLLPYENLQKGNPWYDLWTHARYDRALELLPSISSIDEMKHALQDRKNCEKKVAICSTKEDSDCPTASAFIFDTKNTTAYYAQGNPLTTPFKKYDFTR